VTIAARPAPGRTEIDDMTIAAQISDADFALFRRYIEDLSGIHLGPHKKALLVGRLAKRLRETGVETYREYLKLVSAPGHEAERVRMLDCICTNETRFFREPVHFEIIRERAARAFEERARGGGPRRIRAWSAASSSGEEPYTLAMTLLERFPAADRWDIEILGTDLSTKVLARAEEAVYPAERAADIPERLRSRFLLRGTGPAEGKVKVAPEARALVKLRRMNLVGETWPVTGPFDLILCRNVLIYFTPEMRARIVERLIDRLAPGGMLFLGCAESLHGVTGRVTAIGPAAYQLPTSDRRMS